MTHTIKGLEQVTIVKQDMSGYETQKFLLTFKPNIPNAKITAANFVRTYKEGKRQYGEVIDDTVTYQLTVSASKEMIDTILHGSIAATLEAIQHIPRS